MTETEYRQLQNDSAALLGAAWYFLSGIAQGAQPDVAMVREWCAAYARRSQNQRAALPWLPLTMPRPEEG
jgi:hypothetical protein